MYIVEVYRPRPVPSPSFCSVWKSLEDYCASGGGVGSVTTQCERAGPNDLDVMRQAMREQTRVGIPSLTCDCNIKDKLYNVVVKNLSHCSLQWRSDEVESIF